LEEKSVLRNRDGITSTWHFDPISLSGDSTFTTTSLLRELNNADSTPPADPPVAHPNLRPIHSTAFGRAIVGLDASPLLRGTFTFRFFPRRSRATSLICS
jgi:hypothetical protein